MGRHLADNTDRVELYKQGKTDKEIAAKLYYGPITIYLWRRKNGLPQNGAIRKQDGAQRLELYQHGRTDAEIARLMGYSVRGIWSWRTRRGLPLNKAGRVMSNVKH